MRCSDRGVLPSQWLRTAISTGVISATSPVLEKQVQPNSLDVRLSGEIYRVQSSFLPRDEGMARKLQRFSWYRAPSPEQGLVLERNQVYVAKLCESLRLPVGITGKSNPKSTTGRLDVFTRLVTEYGQSFDEIEEGYNGPLYLEIVPRSFPVIVRPGDSLAQVRFHRGDPSLSREETLSVIDGDTLIMDEKGCRLGAEALVVSNGITLSIHLPKRDETTIGYQARKNTGPIDLQGVGAHRVRHYWDRIYGGSKTLILEPDEFFIFRSKELVRLPPYLCAEMLAFEATSGELRTHYAGFFDSGFGYAADAPSAASGAAVVLEVRSRDVPFLVEDGQLLFKINLMWSCGEPDLLYGKSMGSSYQAQRLQLPKQFSSMLDDRADDADAGQILLPL